MSVQYDEYLSQHIGAVNYGLNWMENNLNFDDSPELYDALMIAIAGFNHDSSKYDPEEYDAYDAYFYGDNKSHKVVQDFNYAWLRHIHNNPHHWQHWILHHDDPKEGVTILEMPKQYVFEMIADWWSFSWKNENPYEIFDWYDKNKDYILLNAKTKTLVMFILKKIRAELDRQKGEKEGE